MSYYICEGCEAEAVDPLPDDWTISAEGDYLCGECAKAMQEAWDALTPEQQAAESADPEQAYEWGAEFVYGLAIAFGSQTITLWLKPWARRAWDWEDNRSTTCWLGFGIWIARDWYGVKEPIDREDAA